MWTRSLLFFLSIPFVPLYAAQVPAGPVKLDIFGSKNIPQGQSGTIAFKLLDAHGQPIRADRDISLHVLATDANVNQQNITIPKGADSAQISVSKNQPGISQIHVEQLGSPAGGLSADTQVAFMPDRGYTPVPPLSLTISAQASSPLRAGIDTALIVVTNMDSQGVPIPLRHSIT